MLPWLLCSQSLHGLWSDRDSLLRLVLQEKGPRLETFNCFVKSYIYIYTHTHTHTHIYIFMLTFILTTIHPKFGAVYSFKDKTVMSQCNDRKTLNRSYTFIFLKDLEPWITWGSALSGQRSCAVSGGTGGAHRDLGPLMKLLRSFLVTVNVLRPRLMCEVSR